MRSFFDTNVLVYLFDEDSPKKKAKAQVLLEQESEAGRAVLSTQVLQEFFVTVTRKLASPLPLDEAEKVVRDFAKLPITQTDLSLIIAAIERIRLSGFSFWDALIVEAALASGATRLYTEDLKHGQVIGGMHVENPFL